LFVPSDSTAQYRHEYLLPEGVQRWGELPPSDRIAAWAVPDSLLQIMSDEDLVDAILRIPGALWIFCDELPHGLTAEL